MGGSNSHVGDNMKKQDELIEKVADFMHDQWSHWMKYLLDNVYRWKVEEGQDKYKTINEPHYVLAFNLYKYERWEKQMNTPYAELSEKEKDSDREWARKLLEVIN